MPNMHKHENYGVVSATELGPAVYDATPIANRPTVTLPCKDIDSVNDVKMWADSGYIVRPVSIVRNVVRYMAMTTDRDAVSGGVQDHAAHSHDIDATGLGGAVTKAWGSDGTTQETVDAADQTVLAAAPSGVQDIGAAQAHASAAAALKDIPLAEEVLDGTDLSAVNVYARAYGRVR